MPEQPRAFLRRPRATLAVAAVSLCVAAAAGLFAFANVVRDDNPALVARTVPFDALAPVLVADRRLTVDSGAEKADRLRAVADSSLRRQAVNSAALRLLAFASSLEKQSADAARFARMSERLSRRDVPTQLWLIEAAVQRGDYRSALMHYDRALKTSVAIQPLLFQVLLKALSDDQVRAELARYVAEGPRWMTSFLLEAGGSDATAPDTARLLIRSRGKVSPEVEAMIAAPLMNRLVGMGETDLAYRYFLTLRGAKPSLAQATGFTAVSTDPRFGPFSWMPQQQARSGATFEQKGTGAGRSIRAFAGAAERGAVLRKVLRLPSGAYRLTETRRLEYADPGGRVFWELRCRVGKQVETIWRSPDDAIAYRVRNVPGPTIPADCPYQELALMVASGEGQQGLELVVEDFGLTR